MSSQIYRAKKDASNPYKAMRRATFEDNRLSWEARGLLGYLLVKPDDWRISVTNLINESPGGRDRVYRILNELIEFGYIKRIEVRTKGKISGYDYLVYEEPCEEKPQQAELIAVEPLPEKPYTALPLTEKADHTNKEVLQSKKEEPLPLDSGVNSKHRRGTKRPPPPPEVKERRDALRQAWLAVSGYQNYDYAQANTGIELLDKAGCAPEEVPGLFRWVKGLGFIKTAIYPQTMFKQLDEYRASTIHTNGHGPPGTNGVVNAEIASML
jgi:hypothetical protein